VLDALQVFGLGRSSLFQFSAYRSLPSVTTFPFRHRRDFEAE
jgi:hypothetical protein